MYQPTTQTQTQTGKTTMNVTELLNQIKEEKQRGVKLDNEIANTRKAIEDLDTSLTKALEAELSKLQEENALKQKELDKLEAKRDKKVEEHKSLLNTINEYESGFSETSVEESEVDGAPSIVVVETKSYDSFEKDEEETPEPVDTTGKKLHLTIVEDTQSETQPLQTSRKERGTPRVHLDATTRQEEVSMESIPF